MAERFVIARLGHRGDGIAETPAGPVFVAGALPGDVVEAERHGERAHLEAVLEPGPDRVAPFVPGAPVCGGCGMAHLALPAQLAWKRDLVREALRAERIEAEVGETIDAHGAGRRRASFHARAGAGGVRLGFMAARSHDVVDLSEHDCPTLAPALKRAVPGLRALAAALLAATGKPTDLVATATATGLDVDVRGTGKLPEPLRLSLTRLAEKHDLARLALHGERIVERRPPLLRFGRAEIALPPGGFLQATEAGEAALARLVLDGVGPARRIADLFAGSGTFALRLAERAAVLAVEADAEALAALDRAARHTPGLKKVTVERRDLFRRPLAPPELAKIDAVVFDPPRAGAEAEAHQLAASRVPRIVAVSCNPATLARDLRILLDGGYRLGAVIPVDQFRHSAHVEAVALLERE